jgi:hypothetical protein
MRNDNALCQGKGKGRGSKEGLDYKREVDERSTTALEIE